MYAQRRGLGLSMKDARGHELSKSDMAEIERMNRENAEAARKAAEANR